uniref:Uncharacterized protein n=1 Tax=Salarias fasciatus TaxID=181472 RepID=A0A672JA08_SALFA
EFRISLRVRVTECVTTVTDRQFKGGIQHFLEKTKPHVCYSLFEQRACARPSARLSCFSQKTRKCTSAISSSPFSLNLLLKNISFRLLTFVDI